MATENVDEVIKDLKKINGFSAYAVLNNDGIVIKYENMTYAEAIHNSSIVLSLSSKASKYIKELFDSPDNEVESIRLRTVEYEMIIAQHGNFTLIVKQSPSKSETRVTDDKSEEKKEEGKEENKEVV